MRRLANVLVMRATIYKGALKKATECRLRKEFRCRGWRIVMDCSVPSTELAQKLNELLLTLQLER